MRTPKIIVFGENCLDFSSFSPSKNQIKWVVHWDDLLNYGNLDKLNHECLHWILEGFISPGASVKLDNVDRWPDFNISRIEQTEDS